MKTIFCFLLSMFLFFSSPSLAQVDPVSPVFEGKGDLTLNAGLSLGVIGYGFGYYGDADFPIPLTANLAYGLNEMFSVGPYAGYLRRGYGLAGNRYSFTSIAFGVQGVFHASPFLNELLDMNIDEEKVDLYGKLLLGYETYSWRYNGENLNNWYYNDSGRAIFGPVFGARYMFNPNIGGYAEGGRGAFGWLTLGVSLKL